MKLTYTLKVEDLYQANKLAMQKVSKPFTKFWRVILLIAAIAYLALGIWSFITEIDVANGFIYLLLSFFLATASGVFLKQIARERYAQLLHYQEPTTLTITDQGVQTENKYFSHQLKWPSIVKVFHNEHILTVHPFDMVFTPIPRSTVSTAKEWDELVSLVETKSRETNEQKEK